MRLHYTILTIWTLALVAVYPGGIFAQEKNDPRALTAVALKVAEAARQLADAAEEFAQTASEYEGQIAELEASPSEAPVNEDDDLWEETKESADLVSNNGSKKSSNGNKKGLTVEVPDHKIIGDRVEKENLDTTFGYIKTLASSGAFRIRDKATRAYFADTTGEGATLQFRYFGPTDEVSYLASGNTKEQVGIKLRARDTCNTVYVMWEVGEGIIPFLKSNPNMTRHDECSNGGYSRLEADFQDSVPELKEGARQTLTAEIIDEELLVYVGSSVVWRGDLPEAAQDLEGPAGIRTDNFKADVFVNAL